MNDKETFAAYRRTAPRLDIAFIATQCPTLLAVNTEAAELATKARPDRNDATRMACLWRMYGGNS